MKSFSLGNQKMVLDRGRYKQAENAGSYSEKKGSGFLTKPEQKPRPNLVQAVQKRAEERKAAPVQQAKKTMDKVTQRSQRTTDPRM